MTEQDLREINLTAVLSGFIVDWMTSELVGLLIAVVMLALQGISLNADDPLPPDVVLARQLVGVGGAVVGGIVAGYIARQRGSLHGVLGSIVGLFASFCFYGFALEVGFLGFIVLNLIGAGYGGGIGERWRARREQE